MGIGTDTDVLARLAAGARDIAARAGEKIMEVYARDIAVTSKDDDSPLTEADLAANTLICTELRALTPDIPILSEESAGVPWSERGTWQRHWLVDPLDGTREFIGRNGQFTVNIALIEAHRPVLGVVHVPAQRRCFSAWRGGGAHLQEDTGTRRIHTRPTQVGKFVLAGSRSHASPEQVHFFAALGDGVEVLSMGSSLKFCLVAEGRVDLYPRFGPTSEWDTAAAHCVVEAAGGIVTGLDFVPLQYNRGPGLLNPHFLVIGDPSFDWRPYLAGAKPG